MEFHSLAHAPYKVFKRVGIPGPKPRAFYGNHKDISEIGPLKFHKYLSETYGPVVGYYVGASPMLLVSDLDMIKDIFVKHFHTAFTNRMPMQFLYRKDYQYGKPSLNVVFAEDDIWRRIRHTLNPSLTGHKIKLMVPSISACVKRLLDEMEKLQKAGTVTDFHKLFEVLVMEVVMASVFGHPVDIHGSGDNRLVEAATGAVISEEASQAESSITKWLSHFPWLGFFLAPFTRRSTLAEDWDFLSKTAEAVIKERRQDGNNSRKDILQLMLDAQKENANNENKGLTDEEIVTQCQVFLVGAYDSTTSALSYTSYLLALHPDIQDRLREEIEEYFADNPDASFFQAAQDIEYLDNVINESLRLYPPFHLLMRHCSKDITIHGTTIPKGCNVIIAIDQIHHNAEFWPEPENFDPERFSPEARGERHPLAFLPFGTGPRNCFGMRFVYLEMKIAFIEILRRFKFVRVQETEVPLQLKPGVAVSPLNGIKLKLEAVQ